MRWMLYELLLIIGLLLYLPSAMWRKRLPHRGWMMRLGRYPAAVADRLRGQHAIWIHAVSVGEVVAAQPLVRELARAFPEHPLVLSTITPTGFAVASTQLVDCAIPIYLPLDLGVCVRRALDMLHPRVLILMESEWWPTVIRLAHARRIPMAVVNGRISARAFARYRWVRPWVRDMLGQIDRLLMQSQVDADHVLALGAPPSRVQVVGSLKWEASLRARPSPHDIHAISLRLGLNGQDPMIVAGSTHRGEEAAVLRAFQTLKSSHPHLRVILAPRHLERVAEVDGLIRQFGLTGVRLSQASGERRWDVGLVDTLGHLPCYYGLASVVFVGGSLIPHGGQNPLEPASLGKPILFGPFMQNFAEIADQLLAHQAARRLATQAELIPALQACLSDRASAQAMGQRAQDLTTRSHGALQRTLDTVKQLLTGPSSCQKA